jgi:hypothetical protein
LVNVKRSRLLFTAVAVCRHAALQPVVLFFRAEGELKVKQEKTDVTCQLQLTKVNLTGS